MLGNKRRGLLQWSSIELESAASFLRRRSEQPERCSSAAMAKAEAAAEREGARVWKGNEESLKTAVALLEEMGLPGGLLPLAEVEEIGYVEATGYMWITQKKKVEHQFKLAGKLVSYDAHITGYLEKLRIKKLKGIKAKELLLWPPVGEIKLDDPPTGKIHFKSFAGITKTFPVEAFALGQ